jgi:hypothetical protein
MSATTADEEFSAILHWLSPVDVYESHEVAQSLRLDNTCNWVMGCDQFRNWMSATEQSLLWLTGSRTSSTGAHFSWTLLTLF